MSKMVEKVNSLLKAIQDGDQTRYKELYDITVNYLRYVAFVNLRTKDNLDDVISEVFKRVYMYISHFDPTQNGFNWLCRIAANTARNFNKEESQLYPVENVDTLDVSVASEAFERVDLSIDIFNALKKLDSKDYEVACRRYYLDETEEQIGKAMNITKPAVCLRLKKIHKLLKKFL